MSPQAIPELSRIISLEKISGTTQLVYEVTASEKERQDLAKRFSIVAVESLKATFTISHSTDPGCYVIDGVLNAHVIQSCVVTLENVPESVQMPIHIVLKPEAQKPSFEEGSPDPAEESDIDFVREDGTVDVGEISSQYLALSLNPYPRSPSVQERLKVSSGEAPDGPKNPFAVLKKLKK